MRLTKKLNIALVLVVVCLVLVIGVSYAWLTIAINPEVQRIETNVGANGSLEIALLSDLTFADPTRIMTSVGDSAAKQDVLESNKSWGNVIQLGNGYGLEEIVLLPARLNVAGSEEGVLRVNSSMLKTAEFGIDGRIRILSDDTVSTTWDKEFDKGNFTYYVNNQRYGVRAIGTISNLSAQQTALAASRTLVRTYTAGAARSVQSTWREYGAGVVDIFYRHFVLKKDNFTEEDAAGVQGFAAGIQEAVEYMVDAMYQALIGLVAANQPDEPAFEALLDQIQDPANYGKVSGLVAALDDSDEQFRELKDILVSAEQKLARAQEAVNFSLYLSRECNWENMEKVFDILMSPELIYMGDKRLTDADAFADLTHDNQILISPDSGLLGEMADYTGNFISYTTWKDNISVEAFTASAQKEGILLRMQALLNSVTAATGGWTRTNLDDVYGFAVDLAFRSNEPAELQLQTEAELRVEDGTENSVTQGGGSFMQFESDNMDTEQLITLMNTIRVGFISDRGELLSIAKLDLSKSRETEGVVQAPLRLWNYALEEGGQLTVSERREDAVIRDLPQNAPVLVTVVVWLDGDSVDNSMVGTLTHQTMSGIMNLQFSSSADLIPSEQLMERE